MRLAAGAVIGLLAISGIACAASVQPAATPTTTPVSTVPAATAPRIIGAVPVEFLEPILDDVAGITGVSREELVVRREERVTWPDAGLGCPRPGMVYPQVLVPGYWVVIEARGQQFDYRGAHSGGLRRCTIPEQERRGPVSSE